MEQRLDRISVALSYQERGMIRSLAERYNTSESAVLRLAVMRLAEDTFRRDVETLMTVNTVGGNYGNHTRTQG